MEQNMKKSAEAEVTGAPQAKCAQIRFSARDWLSLPMALGCSLLWFSAFGMEAMFGETLRFPALGAAAFTAALWASVLLYLGRDAKWNRWNASLAVMVGLLTVCCCVYGDMDVRMINFLLIAAGSALCFFSLSGQASSALWEVRAAPETLGLSARSIFSNWDKPFRALSGLGAGGRKTARQIALGIVCGAGVLAIVFPLLISADAVFGALFSGMDEWFGRLDTLAMWRIIRAALMTMAIFSALYFLRHGRARERVERMASDRPAAPFITALSLLCAVYAVFCAIQLAYLFGGAEAASMEGGYAEYARSGFFQLAWVAAINLTVILACAALCGGSRAVRIMSTALLALTAVILLSALWRMRLYILAFGLTLRRAQTLWAMAFIAVCLAAAALRIWKRGFRFWPFFAAVGLAGWIAFNCVNIDARIADYNVDAYLGGELEEIDAGYLACTSPDALPALERLRGATEGALPEAMSDELDSAIARLRSLSPDGWTDWCLSYVRYR